MLRKIIKNRKASSYWFIYSLAFLFVLTILMIIFGQILNVNLYPISQDLTGGDMTEPNKWLSFWNFTPYIIVLIVLVFIFFKLTSRESVGE